MTLTDAVFETRIISYVQNNTKIYGYGKSGCTKY